MRKSALSTKSNKVYNPNSLEVIGDKINLLIPIKKSKSSKAFTKKTLKFDDQEEPYAIQKPCQININHPQTKAAGKFTYKNCLKTSVTEYTNTEVSNKVLRQIRETSKVEDFERILRNLCQSDNFLSGKNYMGQNKRDELLESIEAEDLYEEFFGKHFDYLSSVVNKAREEEHQN